MITVFKYPLYLGVCQHNLPMGAKVLHVGEQFGKIFAWVELDTDMVALQPRSFEVVATGSPVPHRGIYHGTVALAGGGLIYHVYET